MAEIVSLEAAKVAAGTKLRNDEALGRIHVVSLSSPAVVAWAQNDVMESPVDLPVGTRVIGYVLYHGALGSNVTMDIGLRASPNVDAAQTVIDVDGIADGLDVASAGIKSSFSAAGNLIGIGVQTIYRTTQVSRLYVSLLSANPTDDIQFRLDVLVALPG